jgi:hypothetical protein
MMDRPFLAVVVEDPEESMDLLVYQELVLPLLSIQRIVCVEDVLDVILEIQDCSVLMMVDVAVEKVVVVIDFNVPYVKDRLRILYQEQQEVEAALVGVGKVFRRQGRMVLVEMQDPQVGALTLVEMVELVKQEEMVEIGQPMDRQLLDQSMQDLQEGQ